jgi:hypothetical protein
MYSDVTVKVIQSNKRQINVKSSQFVQAVSHGHKINVKSSQSQQNHIFKGPDHSNQKARQEKARQVPALVDRQTSMSRSFAVLWHTPMWLLSRPLTREKNDMKHTRKYQKEIFVARQEGSEGCSCIAQEARERVHHCQGRSWYQSTTGVKVSLSTCPSWPYLPRL